MAASFSMKPAWAYRPGPDVAPSAPPGLCRAQALARAAAQFGVSVAKAGISEAEIEQQVHEYLHRHGATGVWTITTVGAGENARVCFPTQGPGEQIAAEQDIVIIDVHPITQEGFWGDCTRTAIVGDAPQAQAALHDLQAIHHAMLSRCRPGMPANELFAMTAERLAAEGFILLDLLGNIGHSLSAGAAYTHGFIDADNASPMWGAWAIEPFALRDEMAVKVEDVVWFGRDRCTVL